MEMDLQFRQKRMEQGLRGLGINLKAARLEVPRNMRISHPIYS
jgi:hypothetical protein